MSTQTLTNADAILKNVYRGPIVDLLNQETYLIDQLEKTNVNDIGSWDGQGRQLVFAVHSARNRGRGAIADGGTLATAGVQSYLNGIETIRYYNTGIELTDLVVKQSQTDEGAFIRALSSEMDGAMQDLRKDISRICYGTGDGLLASCTASDSTTTTIHVDSAQYIAVGDTVDVVVRSSGATSTGALGRQVTAVAFTGTKNGSTQANATITIGGGNITVDNTFGVYVAGDRSNEGAGLRNITNTARTLHNINSSTYPVWDGNINAAGWVNVSEDALMSLAQTIRVRTGKAIDTLLTTFGVQKRLAQTYQSQKRWNDAQGLKVDGGYSAINVASGAGAIPVVADVDCVNGYVFALNKPTFAWAEVDRPDWLLAPDGKGSILHLKDGSSAGTKVATWQAWIAWPSTLINVAPNRNGQISQLYDDVPVTRL